MTHILVTGGAGFIGSHACTALRDAGYTPVLFDNLSNGHKDGMEDFILIEGNTRDAAALDDAFSRFDISAVMHFAAFIEAGESVKDPLTFYDNNVGGTVSLLQAMKKHGVRDMVFSSTAAVYGEPAGTEPLVESLPKAPINPYGQSKLAAEHILQDCAAAYGLRAIALRYFNAAGSHPAGHIGERHDPETHLIPLVIQAAIGMRSDIKIFGTDYPTRDGSCIRDYIHVCDLAEAHVCALEYLRKLDGPAGTGFFDAFNLGTKTGYSVREVIDAVRAVSGASFTVTEAERRAGDPSTLVADPTRAQSILGWQAFRSDLATIAADAWAYLAPYYQSKMAEKAGAGHR
ncbi:UDP-glucose 4-epimerase GalE [Kordiimonas sediminis]|uniref:UDP-glucose 4-epimerase n=1 Tax=Kordiimonas sediminis TaxID=1735581 RepID=A0A919E6C5_9PROT|nr:UDP-glucose 4-epimerase GalE [Kordiimonas sediminis]GHF18460.1 UDP-glucose 4-epimerase GalE [Kordiimonas sediminis]